MPSTEDNHFHGLVCFKNVLFLFCPNRTARDFDTRPGLKYLLMKVSGVCGAANLYRQSAMSFNLYFQALLSATLSQAEGMTQQQVQPTYIQLRDFHLLYSRGRPRNS